MHALEWIQQHGRYRRSIGADLLRRKLERQKGECTWCAGPVPRGRHRWCGEGCVTAFRDRCDVGWIGRQVARRDKGVCAKCGEKKAWEADHIVPVVEGGGLCDLTGYRTLCCRCHKAETKLLAGRRASARRPAEELPLFAEPA